MRAGKPVKKNRPEEITPEEIARWLEQKQRGLPLDRFALHLGEVLRANRRIPIVSRKTPRATVRKLLLRSLSLLEFLEGCGVLAAQRRGVSVVDIGSGGGFPGVVWKLARPDLDLTLVERSTSKADFLLRLEALLGVEVTVVEKDVRELARLEAYSNRFDVAVAMAVAPPERLYKPVHGILKPGGFFASIRGFGVKIVPAEIGESFRLHSAVRVEDRVELVYRKL